MHALVVWMVILRRYFLVCVRFVRSFSGSKRASKSDCNGSDENEPKSQLIKSNDDDDGANCRPMRASELLRATQPTSIHLLQADLCILLARTSLLHKGKRTERDDSCDEFSWPTMHFYSFLSRAAPRRNSRFGRQTRRLSSWLSVLETLLKRFSDSCRRHRSAGRVSAQ